MARRIKLLSGLSTLAVTGALALSACGGEGEGAEGEAAAPAAESNMSAEGEGENAGSEGEGAPEGEGEGAGAGTGDPATDDVEYIHHLGLVRGHLIAFLELYRAGETEAALTHAKHPDSELYQGLVPAFKARGEAGFAEPLAALTSAAHENGDIEQAYVRLTNAIGENFPDSNTAAHILAVSQIVRTAADEFAIGVAKDGTVVNAHEYQDAYGFLVAGREILTSLETNDVNENDAITLAYEQIELALESFHGLTAATNEGTASTLYGAAARIEIAALGLR